MREDIDSHAKKDSATLEIAESELEAQLLLERCETDEVYRRLHFLVYDDSLPVERRHRVLTDLDPPQSRAADLMKGDRTFETIDGTTITYYDPDLPRQNEVNKEAHALNPRRATKKDIIIGLRSIFLITETEDAVLEISAANDTRTGLNGTQECVEVYLRKQNEDGKWVRTGNGTPRLFLFGPGLNHGANRDAIAFNTVTQSEIHEFLDKYELIRSMNLSDSELKRLIIKSQLVDLLATSTPVSANYLGTRHFEGVEYTY